MNKFQADKVFFTADCHFDHTNIIRYCNRPFKQASVMNEVLIHNWNNTVSEDDSIFILGDFCFGGSDRWIKLLDKLNGEKYLILGNHDKIKSIPLSRFKGVKDIMAINIIGDDQISSQDLFLCHYPMISWAGSNRGSWQLFGHIHSNKDINNSISKILSPNQYDVGVDNNNYKPVSFQSLKENIIRQNLYGNK